VETDQGENVHVLQGEETLQILSSSALVVGDSSDEPGPSLQLHNMAPCRLPWNCRVRFSELQLAHLPCDNTTRIAIETMAPLSKARVWYACVCPLVAQPLDRAVVILLPI